MRLVLAMLVSVNRRLVRTSKHGYLGRVTATGQGDGKVALLRGARVSFIIRQLNMNGEQNEGIRLLVTVTSMALWTVKPRRTIVKYWLSVRMKSSIRSHFNILLT
jgi:hypothetical protein